MKRSAPNSSKRVSPPPLRRKIGSTTTNKAVASFFKPASQKPSDQLIWKIFGESLITVRYKPSDAPSSNVAQALNDPKDNHASKIAAFDLDDTLITANSGNKWARHANSWKWWDGSVPARLKQLYSEGYIVIIMSNQGNVIPKADSKSLANLKACINSVLQQLDLPIHFYAATIQDRYRKPRTGMWQKLLDDLQLYDSIDMDNSFYVGDAGGREKTETRPKDHSNCDRELAANIGINFHTPEEFFLKAQPEPYKPLFDPPVYLANLESAAVANAELSVTAPFIKKNPQELVIFCGSPGAGKSSFFWDVLQPLGYERVNQDILKTRDRCIRKAKELLGEEKSVAVDNTNADIETRANWVRVAREFNVPIRCVRFTASTRLAEHNDVVRALNPGTMNPEARTILPGIAFSSFAKRFQEPTLKEGFQDIHKVDFEFKGTDEDKKIWSRYWVSKFAT